MDIYRDVAQASSTAGTPTTATAPEEAGHLAARTAPRRRRGPSGHDGHCRELNTAGQVEEYQAQGRTPIVRFRMPDETITFTDLVRGELTFTPENVPDYGIVPRQRGPVVHAENPVDDALMEITHVLRGEDLLSPSTPRQRSPCTRR